MAMFAIFPWLMLFVFLVVPIGLVATAGTPLSRQDYVRRVVIEFGSLIFLILLAEISTRFGGPIVLELIILAGLLKLGLGVAAFRWVARRFLDIGYNQCWSLVLLIPIVNIFLELILCFIKSPKRANQDVASTSD
jgi:hypothetical protein